MENLKTASLPTKIALALLMGVVLFLSSYSLIVRNKLKTLERQANAQMQQYLEQNAECAENVQEKEIINAGWFYKYKSLETRIDSLAQAAQQREDLLKRAINQSNRKSAVLDSALKAEQSIRIAAERTNAELREKIEALEFNYETAIAVAAKHAEEKKRLENQMLAEAKTRPSPFEFSTEIVTGAVRYDSTDHPIVHLSYNSAAIRGKTPLTTTPEVLIIPDIPTVGSVQPSHDSRVTRQELRVHMIQKNTLYRQLFNTDYSTQDSNISLSE